MQAVFQFINAGLDLGKGPVNSRIGVDNQVQLAAQVVEHHDFIGHHQQDVRRTDLIGRTALAQALFDIAHGVIAEVAHQAAVKPGQLVQIRSVKAHLVRLHEGQRIVHLFGFDNLAAAADLDPMVKHLQHFMAGQADDGVTAPFLAALDGLEQVGTGPAGEFEISAQRRVEVGQHLAVHGDTVKAGVGELRELLGCHGTVS